MSFTSASSSMGTFVVGPLTPDMDSFSVEQINSVHDLKNNIPVLFAKLEELELNAELKDRVCAYLETAMHCHMEDCPRICLVGETGSGKTSLMNAILGGDFLPSVVDSDDDGFSVTSKVTEVVHDPQMPKDSFSITLRMASDEEWKIMKKLFVQTLKADLETPTTEIQLGIAQAVFTKAFPGLDPDLVTMDTPEDNEFLAMLTMGPLPPMLCKGVLDAKSQLAACIHMAAAQDQVWSALTQSVRLVGNFPLIPKDAVLVDLPGLEDTNIMCSQLAERYFTLHCTHCWFCLPKSQNKLKCKGSIARQIRVLARGGRVRNLVLVRTKVDECPRKAQSTMVKEWEQFKEHCMSAQSGLDLTTMPSSWVAVTTAPASEQFTADVDIKEIKGVLADISNTQQAAARELASVALLKVDGMVSNVARETAKLVQSQLDCLEDEIGFFRAKLLDANPTPLIEALVKELTRAGKPNWKILEAVLNKTGYCYTSPAMPNHPFNLRQTLMNAIKLGELGRLENAWTALINRMIDLVSSVKDLPSDFRSLIGAKCNRLQTQINGVMAPRGTINDLLSIALNEPESGTGYTDNVCTMAETILRADVGIPSFLVRLAMKLADGAEQLIHELRSLVEQRFLVDKLFLHIDDKDDEPSRKKKKFTGRLVRLKGEPCIICKTEKAVARARHVRCVCKAPRIPYACLLHAAELDVKSSRCPLCRGGDYTP